MKRVVKKVIGLTAMILLLIVFAGNHSFVQAEENTEDIVYLCTGNALGLIDIDINMDVAIQSTVPDERTPGESFTVEDVQTTIDMEVSDTLRNFINPLEGTVSAFQLGFENAEEETVNIAGDGLAFGPVDVPDDADTVQFSVPDEGGLSANNTAGEEGTVDVIAGPFTTVVSTSLADVEVECVPVDGQDLTINSMTIAKDGEDGEDTEAPVITLLGDNPMEMEVGDTYEEPGATSEDNVDGDMTDQIEITGDVNTDEAGEYEITYTVTDEAGNEATETRTVIVAEPGGNGEDDEDTVAPIITLNGDNPLQLTVGETYEEPGATAEDDVDGDVSDDIEITSEVDTATAGDYEVTYTVTDEAGNVAIETRTVIVAETDDADNGEDGTDGENGADGQDGVDGAEGADGADGTNGTDGTDGTDGADGQDGKDGENLATFTEDNGSGYNGANRLPNTATLTPLLIVLGSLFIITGSAVLYYRKKLIA